MKFIKVTADISNEKGESISRGQAQDIYLNADLIGGIIDKQVFLKGGAIAQLLGGKFYANFTLATGVSIESING